MWCNHPSDTPETETETEADTETVTVTGTGTGTGTEAETEAETEAVGRTDRDRQTDKDTDTDARTQEKREEHVKRAFEEKLKGAGEMAHLLDKDFWRSLAQGLSIADSPAAATLAGMQVKVE